MPQPIIFITGATGFIGSHVVSQTLDAGYQVRLSVRKESQIKGLKSLFPEHAAKLDFVVIPELDKSGVFDQALQGVEYVFHIASPMPGKGSDFKRDYLGPAVQGTTTLLDAAKTINTVKRIVVVSSVLSLVPLGALVTGKSHAIEGANPTIPVDHEMEFPADPTVNAGLKYHASKILAHRATLDWVQKQKPHFTVITLHPSFVYGRSLIQTSADGLDGTNGMLWGALFSEKPPMASTSVDVKDVALAHLKALKLNVGGGSEVEEFLLSASGWTWDRLVNFVKEKYPNLGVKLVGPFEEAAVVETKRAEELLGIQWRKMEDTVSDFLDQQLELRSQL